MSMAPPLQSRRPRTTCGLVRVVKEKRITRWFNSLYFQCRKMLSRCEAFYFSSLPDISILAIQRAHARFQTGKRDTLPDHLALAASKGWRFSTTGGSDV